MLTQYLNMFFSFIKFTIYDEKVPDLWAQTYGFYIYLFEGGACSGLLVTIWDVDYVERMTDYSQMHSVKYTMKFCYLFLMGDWKKLSTRTQRNTNALTVILNIKFV